MDVVECIYELCISLPLLRLIKLIKWHVKMLIRNYHRYKASIHDRVCMTILRKSHRQIYKKLDRNVIPSDIVPHINSM